LPRSPTPSPRRSGHWKPTAQGGQPLRAGSRNQRIEPSVDEGRLFRQTGEISGASDLLVIEIERCSHLHQLYITIQMFRRGDESDLRRAGEEWPAGSLLSDSWLYS